MSNRRATQCARGLAPAQPAQPMPQVFGKPDVARPELVKQLAEARSWPVFQPKTLRKPDAAALLREAERPVVMAGTNLWWGRGEEALLRLIEERRIPVFLNGLARGCVPADHELAFLHPLDVGHKQGSKQALMQAVTALGRKQMLARVMSLSTCRYQR